MKKLILPILLCCIAATTAFTQTVNITFELNVATLGNNVDPTGLFIGGGTGFGGPTDNPMTDGGNGIWTITVQRNVGFSSHYTFLNGNGGWGAKENIGGLPCSDPNNFNDRFLPYVTQDTTVKACFGTCDSDGTCTIVTDSIDITFMVNTATLTTVDPAGIFLAGGGSFGVPGDNPMTDDGTGMWSITVKKPKGFASFYTFANGACSDFSCKEDLDGLPCGDPNNFNDRVLPAVYSDTTLMTCYGACSSDGTCPTNTNGLLTDKSLFTLRPTIVSNYANIAFGANHLHTEKQITVVNAVGQIVLSTIVSNTNNYQLDATDFSNGLYFISVNTAETKLTTKFVVAK